MQRNIIVFQNTISESQSHVKGFKKLIILLIILKNKNTLCGLSAIVIRETGRMTKIYLDMRLDSPISESKLTIRKRLVLDVIFLNIQLSYGL
jgi:hypothetical protein